MALTQIDSNAIQPGAITQEKIANTVTLGSAVPKIANVQIANSSWGVLDDTAVSVDGGYILINGEGFASGCQVLINQTPASSVSVVSNTQLRVTVPASSAGTYVAYVINPDGGTAIGVNALTYSSFPSWVTGSTLTNAISDAEYSYQLEATGATSYTLQSGSSLPANSTLYANGLLIGTTTVESNTNYSFTVLATDNENQDSPRTFSLDISLQVQPNTILLINGNGSNNSTTFIDSSSSNNLLTRLGNAVIRTDIKKYGNGSIYCQTSSDGIFTNGINLTGDYTIEAWFKPGRSGSEKFFVLQGVNANNGFLIGASTSEIRWRAEGQKDIIYSISDTDWYHLAIVRSGSTVKMYYNGTSVGQNTYTQSILSSVGNLYVGTSNRLSDSFGSNGHIDDFRITAGTARYTSNFTPPISELTP